MSPTLEQVKEWVEELIPSVVNSDAHQMHYTWIVDRLELSLMRVDISGEFFVDVDFWISNDMQTIQFIAPQSKAEFDQLLKLTRVLELSGVIDKG